ncbi:unnamed protein product [Effrenium voratum]|nr:unnamed protein product [Effrenium voratum]
MVLREEWRGTIPEPSVSRVPEKRSRRHCVFIAAVAVTVAIGLRLGATEVGASDLEHYGAHTLVLLRHGESEWNLENRFTGWVDVDVSEKGAEEAIHAGKLMHNANLSLDVAFTSYQKRAIKTLNLALEEMNALWIPVTKSWKLNERMYGDLQGLDKKETSEQFGEEKVSKWRRSFAVPPPPIKEDSPYHPKLAAALANCPAIYCKGMTLARHRTIGEGGYSRKSDVTKS